MNQQKLDIQGHRGCRGLMPENTIPAFMKAIDLGVTTLELDVVVNKSGDVIISHEPFFNHEISTGENGLEITEENEKSHNIYPLTYDSIRTYDVGMKAHPKFPIQKKIPTYKPLLKDMVKEIEEYALQMEGVDQPLYNIEIKRVADQDDVFHPIMTDFADRVCEEIAQSGIKKRTTIQCFDVETLKYLNNKEEGWKLVYLIMNMNSIQENIDKLGFVPSVYSPYYQLVTEDLVDYAHKNKMKVIPWTINEVKDIEEMMDLGVDGIISDYPDRVIEIHESRQPINN